MKSFFLSCPLSLALTASLSLSLCVGPVVFAAQPPASERQEKKAAESAAPADTTDKKELKGESQDIKDASTNADKGSKDKGADPTSAAQPETKSEVKSEEKSEVKPVEKAAANQPPATGEYSVEGVDSDHDSERKELESILTVIETEWNAHDLKAVMGHYADEYVNNDGLGKGAVQKLLEEFWKNYPDARAVSKVEKIRVEGNFATVESRDVSVATSEMQGLTNGEMESVSEGQQYFKRLGNVWKIVGDRIDFEKVKLAFDLAKQLNAVFTAPEQVRAGKQFSARLEVSLPPGLNALGSITNQPLTFPQHMPTEKSRDLSSESGPPVLERVMSANTENRNELLTASVILITPSRKLRGLCYMTRRLNIVPDQPEADTTSIAKENGKDKVVSEASKESKDAAGVESAADKGGSEKTSHPSK